MADEEKTEGAVPMNDEAMEQISGGDVEWTYAMRYDVYKGNVCLISFWDKEHALKFMEDDPEYYLWEGKVLCHR